MRWLQFLAIGFLVAALTVGCGKTPNPDTDPPVQELEVPDIDDGSSDD